MTETERAYEQSETWEIVSNIAKSRLVPRHQDILFRRFGVNNSRPQTLSEIASIYRITPERVRQMEQKSIRLIRKFIYRMGW